jgi:hypothetical protein
MESDRRGHVTGRAPTYLINGLNTAIMGETKTGERNWKKKRARRGLTNNLFHKIKYKKKDISTF